MKKIGVFILIGLLLSTIVLGATNQTTEERISQLENKVQKLESRVTMLESIVSAIQNWIRAIFNYNFRRYSQP